MADTANDLAKQLDDTLKLVDEAGINALSEGPAFVAAQRLNDLLDSKLATAAAQRRLADKP